MGDGWRKTETSFMIDQKHISIYPGSSSSAPVLYVNTIEEEGEELYHTCLLYTAIKEGLRVAVNF